MSVSNELVMAASNLSAADFAAAFSHPFFSVRMMLEDEEAAYRTIAAGSIDQQVVRSSLLPVKKRPNANTFSFITIGRTNNNDIVIGVNSVSKFHAMIQQNSGGYTISDAGSKNGTTLNGKRIGRSENATIAAGDELTLSPQVGIAVLDAQDAHALLRRMR